MRDLDLSVGVLVHRERVDHAHRVAFPQALQLGDDLAVKLRVLEPEHDELNRSNGHFSPSGRAATAVRRSHRMAAPGTRAVTGPPSAAPTLPGPGSAHLMRMG